MQKNTKSVHLALLIWLGLFLLISVSASAETGKAVTTGAIDSGWELVFEDDFNRDELGDDWAVFEGVWEVEDGGLVGSGTLISTEGFPQRGRPGFLRMEFEVRTDVQPFFLLPGAAADDVSVSDLSSFIHGPPHTGEPGAVRPTRRGYFFQFGGMMNRHNRIRRAGVEVVADTDPSVLIEPGKLYTIVVENDEGDLRLIVDGETVLEFEDQMIISGEGFDRVGFYFYTRSRVENVRVFTKRMPDGFL